MVYGEADKMLHRLRQLLVRTVNIYVAHEVYPGSNSGQEAPFEEEKKKQVNYSIMTI